MVFIDDVQFDTDDDDLYSIREGKSWCFFVCVCSCKMLLLNFLDLSVVAPISIVDY